MSCLRNRTMVWTVALLGVSLCSWADFLIGSPEMAPSVVSANGAVRGDWGAFELKVEAPANAQVTGQDYTMSPGPTVVTKASAETVTVTQTVYRAPIAPAGVDVVLARIENAGSAETPVRLSVSVPKEMGLGEIVGVMGGRPVLALPQNAAPARRMKAWGCVGGVVAMPGWARPQGECDPAFKNISAGMGGVPIEYQFAVPAREKRKVILGFCESFHSQAGVRPLEIVVEGTPKMEFDPIAAWGQHIPGCLPFDTFDENGDGYITVQVNPHPRASDTNPILNVIWVFKPDAAVDLDAVKKGAKSGEAEYYVSVGGEKDQTLYENGPFAYDLKLAPGQVQEFAFLLAAPGGTVPNMKTTAWTFASMRKAADDVWLDWFKPGKNLLDPAAEPARKACAQIILCRTQADGFCLALPEPGRLDLFSNAAAARMVARLDEAGLCGEAERLLRVYWDKPVPQAFAAFAQQEDGSWTDAAKDVCASAFALQALARHGLLTGRSDWVKSAWPAIKAGADSLQKPETQAGLATPEAKQAAEAALHAVEQLKAACPALTQ